MHELKKQRRPPECVFTAVAFPRTFLCNNIKWFDIAHFPKDALGLSTDYWVRLWPALFPFCFISSSVCVHPLMPSPSLHLRTLSLPCLCCSFIAALITFFFCSQMLSSFTCLPWNIPFVPFCWTVYFFLLPEGCPVFLRLFHVFFSTPTRVPDQPMTLILRWFQVLFPSWGCGTLFAQFAQ